MQKSPYDIIKSRYITEKAQVLASLKDSQSNACLKKFDKPTMVIWAADDYYISPSWGKRLAEDIPGTKEFHLVPFCGHFWQEEKPAEFSSKIAVFLVKTLIGNEYNIPVIYISGDSEKDTIEGAVLKNTYGFLTKPLHKETLQVTVDFAIAKHKLISNIC